MGKINELNIKNQRYYFFNDMINIKDFHSNLLKIDKKPYKDLDIYYIGYIMIKKIGDCENIHSITSLYLIIHSATGYIKEKNGEKYLVLDPIEKYEEVFFGIKSEIETINSGEELLKFPSLTIIIRCIFQNGKKLYPQVYLDECLYKL